MATKPAKKATASKTAKKAPAKKAPAKKAAPKSAPAKKAAKKAPAKKAPAKKAAPKKAVKKAPAKKAPAKKAVAKKAPAKKVPAKQPAKKAAPKKEVAKKVAPKKEAPKKEAPKKETAKKVAEVKPAPVVAPPAPPVINPIGGTAIPQVRKAVPGKKPAPKQPVVEIDGSKWLRSELNQVQKKLEKEAEELLREIHQAEESFEELIFESGEGAGDDQADAGTKTFEREQEISILANKRDLYDQTQHALERIAAGTYGLCENCGNPIGKERLLEANPRATLCMPCRQKEDRG